MTEELKLFVWVDFYPKRTDGLAFAVAETEEEAMDLVIEATRIDPVRYVDPEYGKPEIDWGTLEVRSLTSGEKFAYGVLGGE